MDKASPATRTWYVLVSIVIFAGIGLTGFSRAHWLLYVPAAGFLLAAIIGVCPSQRLIERFFKKK